jgi:amino acid permease
MSAAEPEGGNKHPNGSDIGSAIDKVDFVESNTVPQHESLSRQLKNRHIAMIR